MPGNPSCRYPSAKNKILTWIKTCTDFCMKDQRGRQGLLRGDSQCHSSPVPEPTGTPGHAGRGRAGASSRKAWRCPETIKHRRQLWLPETGPGTGQCESKEEGRAQRSGPAATAASFSLSSSSSQPPAPRQCPLAPQRRHSSLAAQAPGLL